MKSARGTLKHPKSFQHMTPLEYATIHQPLANLQHTLTEAEANRVRNRLLAQPGAFTTFHPVTVRLHTGDTSASLTVLKDTAPDLEPLANNNEPIDANDPSTRPDPLDHWSSLVLTGEV